MGVKRFLRIDKKSFDFALLDEPRGDFLKVMKNGRGIRISIFLEKDGFQWLKKCLEEMMVWNDNFDWVKKFRSSKHTLIMELKAQHTQEI